jgi:hypothetical protein
MVREIMRVFMEARESPDSKIHPESWLKYVLCVIIIAARSVCCNPEPKTPSLYHFSCVFRERSACCSKTLPHVFKEKLCQAGLSTIMAALSLKAPGKPKFKAADESSISIEW